MEDEGKSKEELEAELEKARARISELEAFEHQCRLDEAKIGEQNTFLNQVLESLTHPFYVLDANDYSIKIANSAAKLGKLSSHSTCYSLTHRRAVPCDGTEHVCPLQQVKKTKKPVTLEHVHYDMEGNPRNVEVHAYPIFDPEGNVVQMIEYSLDITERKRLEEEIRNYAEKIKLFAYSISHDLKSPLIGINGLVRLLHNQYRDRLDEKWKTYCDHILKASEEVLSMIEEINFYIKTRETPLDFEPIDPKEIIGQVREEFRTKAADRGVTWVEPERIPEIKAERMSMLRVFRNLVENALKYGGEGLSEIRIGYEESEGFHMFSVYDDGVGIGQEDAEGIFNAFQRHSTAKGLEGTGLGLTIVHEVAKKHGGEAWAEPGPERGVTFYVSLSKTL